jgi:putative FmdB family regulatory protein
MPVYEYWCHDCKRQIDIYVKGEQDSPPQCSLCGGTNLSRLFSSFSFKRGYKDVYDDILSDNRLTRGMLANNPKSLAEWNRKMGGAAGDMTPQSKEVVERLERGERVEKVMGDMQKEMQGDASI